MTAVTVRRNTRKRDEQIGAQGSERLKTLVVRGWNASNVVCSGPAETS